MDRRHAAVALLALAGCIVSSDAAPTASNQTALDLYDGTAEGCYYNFQHYGEGDRIMTNEPCLNCTCHNRMLMCYLRVCPFTKPIGQDCSVEKRADQCCPIVTCPDVPVDLLTSTSTNSPAEYGATGVGKLDKYGCSIDGKYFPEGSKVPPTPNKPCEHCYCIRNMTTCVMQECTLHVDGCTPIYHKDVCCPVRYSCDHEEDEILLLDDMTTTVRPTPGFLLTTTTVSPVTQMSQDCVHDDQIVPDGALIKTEKACEHCYCMKGDIVCVVQECGTPMENEGKNCTSQPPREGQCCPDTYICEGDEITTDLVSDVTTHPSILEELTTLSPPRRAEGSDYRKETDENYTEKTPVTEEGSGYEQTSIPSFDNSAAINTDDQGSGYENNNLPTDGFTDKNGSEDEHTTPSYIGVSDEETTVPDEISYEHTSQKIMTEEGAMTKGESEYEPATTSSIEESTTQKQKHEHTIPPIIDVSDKKPTEQQESTYERTTTIKTSSMDEITTENLDSEHEYTIQPNTETSQKENTEPQESDLGRSTTPKITAPEQSSTEKYDTEHEPTFTPNIGVSDNETTKPQLGDYERLSTTSSIVTDESTSEKYDSERDQTITSTIGVSEKQTTKSQEGESTTTSRSSVTYDITPEKHDVDEEHTETPKIEISDKETTEDQENYNDRTTTASESTSEKHDVEHTVPEITGVFDEETTKRQEGEYEYTTIVDSNVPEKEDSEHTVEPIFENKDIAEQHEIDFERTTTSKTSITDESTSERYDIELQQTLSPSISITDKDTTEPHERDYERTTTSKPSLADESYSEKDENELTTLPSISTSTDKSAEAQESDHKVTTPRITSEGSSKSEENEYVRTTLASIDVVSKDDSSKQDKEDKITTISSIDLSVSEITQRQESESTTYASSDHDRTTLPSKDVFEQTTVPQLSESDKDISPNTEIEQEYTKLPSISVTDDITTQRQVSEHEYTTVPYIQSSDEVTKDNEYVDYQRTTPSKTEVSEDITTEEPKDKKDSTLPINSSDNETSKIPDSGEKRTTVSSIEDINKDISGTEESDNRDSTLSSSDVFDKDVTEKQGIMYESTTLPSDDSNKDISKKDESTTTSSPTKNIDNDITTLQSTTVSDKDIPEQERTTSASVSEFDNTEKQDNRFESTTLSRFTETSEKQGSEHERTTPSSTSTTIIEFERTTLPNVDVSDDVTYTKHPSTIHISDMDTSEKLSTDSTKETTDESLLHITSTAKITTLEDVEITTEPDKGLNTVPIEIIDEEISKPFTTEKTSTFEAEKVTEPASISDDKIYQSMQTTIAFEEVTGPVDHTSISQTKIPFVDDNVMKVTTTESTQKLDTDMTTTVKTLLPEISIIDDSANQVTNYSRIPGEGDCLLNGITYKNNSEVPKSNNCHTSCKCMSSIIKCDPIMCSPPPKYMDNCQPIYDTPESCCPTYICQTRETMPPQPDSHISVTDQPSTSSVQECQGEKCLESHDKESLVPSRKPEDCGPSGCGDKTSAECGDNECYSPVSVTPPQTCEGNNCNTEPIIEPINNVPLCQNEQNCKPQDSSCIGNACLNVDDNDVSSPPKVESCKDNKDCHKQEDDITSECTDEACRRKDTGKLDTELPSVCSGSECTQKLPSKEIDNNKPTTSSEYITQEQSTEKIDQTTLVEEISSAVMQSKYPEISTTAKIDYVDQSTSKSEISNELISEGKPTFEFMETSDTTTKPSNIASEDMTTTLAAELITTIRTDLATQDIEEKDTINLQETIKEGEVTKSPEILKETVMQEQPSTESPNLLFTTSKETDENEIDVHEHINKLPSVEHESQGSFVTDSQDITTKSDDDKNVKTETTHSIGEITTEIPVVTEIKYSTTIASVESSADAEDKDVIEQPDHHITELPDQYTTIAEGDQKTDTPTDISKYEIENESVVSTTQSSEEFMSKEPVYTTSVSKEESPSTSKIFTENDEEFDVQVMTTEPSQMELSTNESDLHSITEPLDTKLQDEKNIEEKPISVVTPVIDEFSDTTSKTTQPSDTLITNTHEESELTEPAATISHSEPSETGIQMTESTVMEQSIGMTPETVSIPEQETEVQSIEKDTESSVVAEDTSHTESSASEIGESEATTQDVQSQNDNEVTTKPFKTTDIIEKETITGPTEYKTETPLLQENEVTDVEPHKATTSKVAETEKPEIATHGVSIITEEIYDIETTTAAHKASEDSTKTSEFSELPAQTTLMGAGESTQRTPDEFSIQTDLPKVSPGLQDIATKIQENLEPETATQPLQTVSPALHTDYDGIRTEPSFVDHTDNSIPQTTETFEYSTKEDDLTDSTKSQEEKLTSAHTFEKETTTMDPSHFDTKGYEKTTQLLQTSTIYTVHKASTEYDVTTHSDINIEETGSDVTEPGVILATNIPEAHKKDQQEATTQPESEHEEGDTTSISQATKYPSEISSESPQEATTHISKEKDTEISSYPDMSTKSSVDITVEHDKEMTKKPIELTTEHALDETSIYSQDKITENIQDLMTTISPDIHDHKISNPPQDISTELPYVTDLDIKETATENLLNTKIDETTEVQEVVTENIRDMTTSSTDEVSEKDIEITSPHDITEKEGLPPSKSQETSTDSLFEKTTEKLDVSTGTSQEMVTLDLFDKEISTIVPDFSTDDFSKSTKESEITTESYILKETTPYVVELEEHTHKIVDDVSTILYTEQETITQLPETQEDVSTDNELKSPEPSSTSSVPIPDTSKSTPTSEIIEKTTLKPLSIKEHELQFTTPISDISENEKDIEVLTPLQTQSTPAHEQSPITDAIIPVQTEKVPTTESTHETDESDKETTITSKDTTEKTDIDITTIPSISKPEKKPSETLPPTKLPAVSKPEIDEMLPTEEMPDDESPFPAYSPELPDYGEEPFGPGTCRYGGKVYVSAQQIPRDDPCDFCFCFRSDIICLQQSCPPPIHGCYEEPIQGFCCPRYECPVAMATSLNVTTTTTTTTTTLPPHFLPHAYKGAAQKRGCQIKGHTYKVGEVVRASSGPCLHCTCGGDGQMKCDPKACTPEPMLRQMIAAAVSAKRRR